MMNTNWSLTPTHKLWIGVAVAVAAVIGGAVVAVWPDESDQQGRKAKAISSQTANRSGSDVAAACPDANRLRFRHENEVSLAEGTVLRALYRGTYNDVYGSEAEGGYLTWSPADGTSLPWGEEDYPFGTDVIASTSMQSEDGNNQYVVLTTTKPESWFQDVPGHPPAPMLGSAVFTRSGRHWVVISCERSHEQLGAYGRIPEPERISLGPGERNTGFLFESGYTATGMTTVSYLIYAVVGDSVKKVLEIRDAFESAQVREDQGYEYNTTLEIIRDDADGFYDLIARKEGTTGEVVTSDDESHWEIEPVSEAARYTFKDGAYQKIN